MKIAVMGIAGKMGQMIAKSVLASKECSLLGGSVLEDDTANGKDIGLLIGQEKLDIFATSKVDALFSKADCLIEFTAPKATLAHLDLAVQYGKKMVIGTTGFSVEEKKKIEEASKKIPIVFSPNMSVGMNILFALSEKVASMLPETYDAEVLEMHHRAKVDAPSGSALELGRSIARGRGVDFDEKSRLSREGKTGARPFGEIGFATLRGGDVVGDHSVIFAGIGERLELSHKASSRESFSNGAVRAACFLNDKTTGLYSMKDVLGL
ncbi:MAG: 4-hydroxy-tetrahydrodipicolinate reductase [Alphaproteobacteria bacterium]|nr:4-hydroxy-tetrahydrodipicolinate reductase [Alphaproteobacteria bacterium]